MAYLASNSCEPSLSEPVNVYITRYLNQDSLPAGQQYYGIEVLRGSDKIKIMLTRTELINLSVGIMQAVK